jgi:hypothetical protein
LFKIQKYIIGETKEKVNAGKTKQSRKGIVEKCVFCSERESAVPYPERD